MAGGLGGGDFLLAVTFLSKFPSQFRFFHHRPGFANVFFTGAGFYQTELFLTQVDIGPRRIQGLGGAVKFLASQRVGVDQALDAIEVLGGEAKLGLRDL